MRTLNIEELEQFIERDATDIRNSELIHLNDKISHFMNFLYSQSISKNILERIGSDFIYIKNTLPPINHNNLDHKTQEKTLSLIKDRENQGAFGYFIIERQYDIKNKHSHHYINTASLWYRPGGNYNLYFDFFLQKFFNPFIDLILWYIYESKSKDENHYYSKNEINKISSKMDTLKQNMDLFDLRRDHGQEILFNEIEELKELILFLNKKNWKQILEGKINDLVSTSIINIDNGEKILEFLIENGIISK